MDAVDLQRRLADRFGTPPDQPLNDNLHDLGHALGMHHDLPDPDDATGLETAEYEVGLAFRTMAWRWRFHHEVSALAIVERAGEVLGFDLEVDLYANDVMEQAVSALLDAQDTPETAYDWLSLDEMNVRVERAKRTVTVERRAQRLARWLRAL